ncbi:MAG: bifunctional precorrin-2 dehydrogenase/sirohydrochlorin ferrochelatase [Halobacteriota archaeon]|nr:bifunctional precorrin-2 dehydrogenase/sirohydrochlorin ferrochelatase [Halobacteriota archaeon]
MLPLVLNLEDRKVVIFGGGSVGERKAELFSKHADTVVVSREFTDAITALGEAGTVELIRDDLTEFDQYIEESFIVIPATSDKDLNDKIAKRARDCGKLVDIVDGLGDVVVPSIISKGDILISISTLGKSPAMCKFIRRQMEDEITDAHASMVRLQDEVRKILKERIGDQKIREKILWDILEDEEVWKGLLESYDKTYSSILKLIERGTLDRNNKHAGNSYKGER